MFTLTSNPDIMSLYYQLNNNVKSQAVERQEHNSDRMNVRHKPVSSRLCHVCGKLLYSQPDLQRHINIHEDIRPFSCTVCDYRFCRKSHLAMHIWCQHTTRPYTCCECQTSYRTPSTLLRHLQFCHKFPVYQKKPPSALCDVCGIIFSNCKALSSHLRFVCGTETRQRNCICGICGKAFTTNSQLIRHQAGHDSRPYKCFECSAEYRFADKLRLHVQLHFLSVVNKPTDSRQDMNFQQAFLAALRRDLKPTVGVCCPFGCSRCGVMFQRLIDAQIHALGHAGVKPFCCAHCNKTFRTKCQLKDHITAVHSNVREFFCQFCRRSFAVIRALRQHMKKQHNCTFTTSVTSQQFSQDVEPQSEEWNTVESGLMVESGQEQSAKQNISDTASGKRSKRCKTVLKWPLSLTQRSLRCRSRTKKARSNTRTFACSQCEKFFQTKIGLDDHVAAMHSTVRPHACQLCERRFAVVRELTRHMKTKHIAPSNHAKSCDVDSVLQSFPRVAQRGLRCRSRTKLSGKRTFACNQCEKVFQTKIGLGDHVAAMHSTVRPHACQLCDSRFAVARELTRHMKTKHASHRPTALL